MWPGLVLVFLLTIRLLPLLAFRLNSTSSSSSWTNLSSSRFFLGWYDRFYLPRSACVSLAASLPFLLPLLSAHLLWAVYKSLSGGVSIGAVSIRASASLSSPLPPNDWRGRRRRRRREHSYITNTHTGYITLWKQCGSSGKSIHDVFSSASALFSPDCFTTFAFIPPHPTSFEDVFRSMKAACCVVSS